MKKLKIIRRLILLLIVFGLLGTCCYIYFFSPKAYQFSQYDYVNTRISSKLNGFKIAYLADINLTDKKSYERFEKIIKEMNEIPFDMVIFGGDLYDGSSFQGKEVSALLKSIDCKYGKFAVLGEKDDHDSLETTQILNNGGFELLENEVRTIYYKNTSFLLYACNKETDISQFKKETKTIKIGVTHEPDSFITHSSSLHLQLSSHSYGGSFYIPYLGALLPNEDAKTYNHGIYTKKGTTLLVSNGVSGPKSFPYKFLAKNEINFITLNSTSSPE